MAPGLFRQTNIQKYTPKTIKLSQLYKFAAKTDQMSPALQETIQKTLSQAGYNKDEINKLIYKDKGLPKMKMQAIFKELNQNKVYGFSQDPNLIIKSYLNKERVKAQSIARIRKEQMLESRGENIATRSVTHLGITKTSGTSYGRGSAPPTKGPVEIKPPPVGGNGKRMDLPF